MGNDVSFTCENSTAYSIVFVTQRTCPDPFDPEVYCDEDLLCPKGKKKFDGKSFNLSCGNLSIDHVSSGYYVFQNSEQLAMIICDHYDAVGGKFLKRHVGKEKNPLYRSIFFKRDCSIIGIPGMDKLFSSCCDVSSKAYEDKTYEDNAYFEKHSGPCEGSFLRNWGIRIDKVNDKAVIILAFQGTLTSFDWLINAALQPSKVEFLEEDNKTATEIMVHSGFWNAVTNSFDKIRSALEELSVDNKRIYITGHSQGAALAQLMYLQLCLLNDGSLAAKVDGVYTFASPMIILNTAGYDPTKSQKVTQWRSKCKNVIYGMDIVGALPRVNDSTLTSIVERSAGFLATSALGFVIDHIHRSLLSTGFRLQYSPAASETFVYYPAVNVLRILLSEEYIEYVDTQFLEAASEEKLDIAKILDFHAPVRYVGIFAPEKTTTSRRYKL